MQAKKILFLCTGNSARSQMAEGIARDLGKGRIEAYSAGLHPKGLHPLAISAMDEMGIDIRLQNSKGANPSLINVMDIIVTVCGHAETQCPVSPPHIQREHWPIQDPAAASGTQKERLEVFRKARDEIKDKIQQFLINFSL